LCRNETALWPLSPRSAGPQHPCRRVDGWSNLLRPTSGGRFRPDPGTTQVSRRLKFAHSKRRRTAEFRVVTPPVSRRLLAVVIVAALALVAGSCGGTEGDPNPTVGTEVRIVSQVLGSPESEDLEIRWFPTSCESFDSLDVEEGDAEVEITITVLVDSGACETPDGEASTTFRLAAPLGDRVVLDGNLGSTVKLNAEPGPPDQ